MKSTKKEKKISNGELNQPIRTQTKRRVINKQEKSL